MPALLPTNTAPRFPTDDPAKMAYQDWLYSQGLGDVSAQWGKDEASRYGDLEEQNQRVAWEMYQDIINNPGYTEEEKQRILQEQGILDLMPSDETLRSWGLQDDEIAGIRGDVNKRAGYFDPAYSEDLQRSGADWTKEAFGKGQRNVVESLKQGEDQTWENLDRGGEGIRRAVGEGASGMRGALGDYGSRLRSTVTGARGDVLSPFEDPSLVMSDEEVAATIAGAGRKVGASYGAAKDELLRRAEAAGNVNPLSLAAARSRLEKDSAVQRANAMTDAELTAKGLQRGQKFDVASARSGAGKYLGTLGAGAESEIGQTGVGTERTIAGMGTEAEKGITGLRTGTALTLGGRRLNTSQDLMSQDVDLNKYLSDEAQGVNRFNQQMGTDVMRDLEGTEQERNTYLAANRQAVEQAKNAARLNAGKFVYPSLREGYTTTANARRGDLGEARQWSTGQQQYAGGQRANAYNQYLQGQQTAIGGAGRATGTAANIWQAKNASSFKNTVGYPLLRQLGGQAIQYGGGRISGSGGGGSSRQPSWP